MTPNEDILSVFQELPDKRKSDLQSLIDEYNFACKLSQKPRSDQLPYWKKMILALEHDLREQLRLN